jgi:hypothetical protein
MCPPSLLCGAPSGHLVGRHGHLGRMRGHLLDSGAPRLHSVVQGFLCRGPLSKSDGGSVLLGPAADVAVPQGLRGELAATEWARRDVLGRHPARCEGCRKCSHFCFAFPAVFPPVLGGVPQNVPVFPAVFVWCSL